MTQGSHPLLFVASSGLLLSWLLVLPNFLALCIFGHSLPPAEALAIFGLAFGVSWMAGTGHLRIIWRLWLHLAGFTLAFTRLLYLFFQPAGSFFDPNWPIVFFSASHGVPEWGSIILIGFWTALFWGGGIVLARRPAAFATIRNWFDTGLGVFCLLFLVKFLVFQKGGSLPGEKTSLILLVLFLVCSMIAFALSQEEGPVKKELLSPYRGTVVTLGFAAVVLLVGLGLVLVFLPWLTACADFGLQGLQTLLRPLVPVILAVLRFVYGPRNLDREATASSPGPGETAQVPSLPETSGWLDLMFMILGGMLFLFLGLLLLLCAGLAARCLWRWLLSKPPAAQTNRPELRFLLNWLHWLARILDRCRNRFGLVRNRRDGAVVLYAALLRWGKRSGLRRDQTETPTEYGERLAGHFPDRAADFRTITTAFNLEFYGKRPLPTAQTEAARRAWNRLLSPGLWLFRLKILLLQPARRPLS
ncbi:MAG: DUF4129 domain-containing protein [Desulfohalobiaceae bacterium]|nr:DUF4129 domain-containing protein [Desulfohalobiaceae bacterium]